MNRSWYTKKVDKESPDTIHQILAYGTLAEIRLLKEKVGGGKIKKLFLQYPKKIYTLPLLNFVKNFILHINSSIDEKKYLKNTLRSIK